jgi:hypothetical protein
MRRCRCVHWRSSISLPRFQPAPRQYLPPPSEPPRPPERCGVLQFLLPLTVHERVFTGTHGGFGLLDMRPEIVVAQLPSRSPAFTG